MPRTANLVTVEVTRAARDAVKKFARKRGLKVYAAASAILLEGVKKP